MVEELGFSKYAILTHFQQDLFNLSQAFVKSTKLHISVILYKSYYLIPGDPKMQAILTSLTRKNTIRDGINCLNAVDRVDHFDMVYTVGAVDTVYTAYTAYTVYTIETALQCKLHCTVNYTVVLKIYLSKSFIKL